MDARTIAAKQFARGAFGSYKSDDVDAFFQEVSSYVKKLEKECDGLKQDLQALAEKTVRELQPFEEVCITRAGCTVSSHCGPGTLGVLFIEK